MTANLPVLMPWRLTDDQRDKVLCAIGWLEDAQFSLHQQHGDSTHRTTICRTLERLYNVLPLPPRKKKR